jgi:hypothetical protein
MPDDATTTPPPDTLNSIGVLKRREIEARILAPIIDALGEEFGRERVVEIVRDQVIKLAQQNGRDTAAMIGGDSMEHLGDTDKWWAMDGALEIEVLRKDAEHYDYNVTRCRYAEMYRALGIPELGAVLSCNRDFSMVEGFNPSIELTRTQTLMGGAAFCDFRYRVRE